MYMHACLSIYHIILDYVYGRVDYIPRDEKNLFGEFLMIHIKIH